MNGVSAEQLLREGNPEQALAQLKQEIRTDPANSRLRIFLFQLLLVQGEWASALTQLDVIKEMDASAIAMVQTYRELIRCEQLREQVFAGNHQPLVFGHPEQWLALLLEALKQETSGQSKEAAELREQAFALAPATAGAVDNESFAWLADADPRLGPVLEAIVNGRYYWVPVTNIKKIDIDKPEDLRDLVWLPAHFVWANEGEVVGFIPARYPGSAKTEWLDIGAGVYHGLGQRILVTDNNEYSVLDIRCITCAVPAEE